MRSFRKNIIRIILSGAVFYLLNRFADVQTEIEAIRFTYAYPFLSCISIVFGPLVAGFAGILGLLFPLLLENAVFQWIDPACLFLFCLSIVIISGHRMNITDGILGPNDITVFIRTQLIVNTFIWLIVRPILYHFVLNVRIAGVLEEGFLMALNRSLSGMLIGTLLLGIITGARYSESWFYRS